MTVTTGTEIVSLNNAFQVTVGPAAIVSALSPDSGAQNQSYNVLVVGSQTHFLQGTTTANFGPYIQVTGVTVTDTLHATVAITIPRYDAAELLRRLADHGRGGRHATRRLHGNQRQSGYLRCESADRPSGRSDLQCQL